jgi:hypothetical protein
MAISFGTRIGGTSLGSWAAYPISDSAGSVAIGIIRGDMASGVVTSAVGATALTSLSTAELTAMSTLLKALIANGSPSANALSFLRSLVGLGGLTNSDDITLSAVLVAGTNYELRATLAAPGTLFAYVPNSAACGIFTGFSSAGAPVPVIPTTQRYDAIANVPGLFLPGAVSMAVPNAAGSSTITLVATKSAGYAENSATAAKDFRVEKINMAAADPGAGAGTLLFNVSFAGVGPGANQQATITSVAGDLTVPAGWLYRVVNPAAIDGSLADVSITVAATIAL